MKNAWLVLLTTAALAFPMVSLRAQNAEEAHHAPDGSTSETVQSIAIPALANAPFTCTVSTEWVKRLEDGSTASVQNHRLVMRDGAGRIFQERRSLVPKVGNREPEVTRL
jgi:hypothetical protein